MSLNKDFALSKVRGWIPLFFGKFLIDTKELNSCNPEIRKTRLEVDVNYAKNNEDLAVKLMMGLEKFLLDKTALISHAFNIEEGPDGNIYLDFYLVYPLENNDSTLLFKWKNAETFYKENIIPFANKILGKDTKSSSRLFS